jgi:diguanylate cyclase (GGDEF)-like protein/PAS domain S-box-containing protein
MDMLPDIVYIKDNAGVYQTVNRAFEQFIGRASGDIVGKTDRELLPPDLAQQCSAADKVLIESGRSLRSEEKQCADGKERYYDTIKVPLFDENGIPAGIVGVSRDITESKKMAEALKSSREHLSLATELAHLGPWKYHPETNLFEFGEEFYAIYGTTVEREGAFMTPETYAREFLLPDDAWLVAEEVKKACSSTTSRYAARVQHRIIRRDGEVRVISVLINIERDASGNVLAWYGTNQDITEWVNAEEALRQKTEENERIAYTDALTGLPNRAGLMKRLEEEIIKVRLNGVPGAVLFIDLDELKMVNDAFGHSYGDALIRVAGSRIAEKAGKNSLVGRIGGDEFIVVLHGIRDRAEIGRVANDIVLDLGDDIEALGIRFHVSASVGIACYPEDGNTAEEVFKNADIAMYAAKRSGKNCWRFYEKEMQIEAFNKMLLANSLRHALERRELSLHYQPIVDITSKGIIGFEALLRWKSPEYGSVPPKRFISLAEQNGMIHPIGEWVLMEACQFVRRLVDAGRKDIYVTVNVSAYQLCAEGFVDSIRCALNNAGIEPCQLELEITENALIASLEEGTRTCQELRAIGVRLALDDFGTGYSSLTYLQRLPVKHPEDR